VEKLRVWLIRSWDLLVLHVMRVFLVFLISLKCLLTRQRMSHQNGIVATGKIKIVEDLDMPANDFFKPGHDFKCRLRHATVRFLDDAVLCPRSASLKFADSDDRSPLDLLMNNGSATPFYSMSTFWGFMQVSIAGGREKITKFMQENPRCYINFRRALRRDPETFAQLYYYTQTIFQFKALDGKERYIRFRLIPENRGQETGIPSREDLETVWFQEAKPDETRSRNYLKEEYRKRVKSKPVIYHLQAQIYEWTPSSNKKIVLNSVYEWPEQNHPWRDVATVTIDGLLEHDNRSNAPDYSIHRGDHVLFSLANRPPSIGLLKAESIRDAASLDYLRAAGVWARRVRLFAMKIFGPVQKISDVRQPKDLDDEQQNTLRADDIYSVACLPQKLAPERRRGRKQRLEVARGSYQFWGGDKSPPYAKNFPQAEAFTSDREHRMEWDLAASVIDLGIADLNDKLDQKLGMAVYDDMYTVLPKPTVSERFKSDEEFGRQRLNGVNPFMIKLCRELPDPAIFPVTDELIEGLLDDDMTLVGALEASRLYMVSYPDLEGIQPKPGRYVTAPICLLYLNGQKKLLPIAIQLGQSPEAGPVFTPRDEFWLWQTVKTFVQSADAQYQELVSHLLRTHLVMETIAVSTHRQLAVGHPVHKLLMPHLRFTMAINHAARSGLLAVGGPIDRVFAIGIKGGLEMVANRWSSPDWTFRSYDLEQDFEDRGVADADVLPGYHYRDDARKVNSILREFVANMIGYFYHEDNDVIEDFELQAWREELTDPVEGNLRGFPQELSTRDELVDLLTTIIFTASAGHSATNNGQYEMYGYIPNAPGEIVSPPPTDREPWTERKLADAMPKGKEAADQIATTHLLSIPTESPLGYYSPKFFAGYPDIVNFVTNFEGQLGTLSRDIGARNKALTVPYTYLDPGRLYPSVEI
jgi:hypothetical protein